MRTNRKNEGVSITVRQWLALAGLALSAFVFTTSEFMPVGLLSSIAASFSIADTQASIMITLYAWCVTLFSLPLMVIASRFDYRHLLLALVALFGAGQFLSAMAASFPLLVLSRLLVAVAHAVFWSIVAVVATRVVTPEHSATAVGMVTGGTSIANIIGMPIGRAIGMAFGWRMTFCCVGVAALITLVCLALTLPPMAAGEPFSIRRLPELAHNRPLVALYGVTVLMACAYYTGYSLIEPFLTQVAHLDEAAVTATLSEFGVAALIGVVLFSCVYKRFRVAFLTVALCVQVMVLQGMLPFTEMPGGMLIIVGLWGVSEACYGTAFQALLIEITSPDDSAVAMSVYSGLFNLGIGGGTALGSAVADMVSLDAIGFVGGAVALAGLVLAVVVLLPMIGSKNAAE